MSAQLYVIAGNVSSCRACLPTLPGHPHSQGVRLSGKNKYRELSLRPALLGDRV